MSLSHLAIAKTDDLPIRHEGNVHSGKVRSVYWLTSEDSERIVQESGCSVPFTTPLGIMVISDRRVIIPDAFYTSDGLCEITLTVLNGMGVYPAVIDRETDRYLPFLTTTKLLMTAVQAGIGREKAHGIIKKYAVDEVLRIREDGSSTSNLAEHLAGDPVFRGAGITRETIDAVLSDRTHSVGNAEQQIVSVCSDIADFIKPYAEDAKYEPEDVL